MHEKGTGGTANSLCDQHKNQWKSLSLWCFPLKIGHKNSNKVELMCMITQSLRKKVVSTPWGANVPLDSLQQQLNVKFAQILSPSQSEFKHINLYPAFTSLLSTKLTLTSLLDKNVEKGKGSVSQSDCKT